LVETFARTPRESSTLLRLEKVAWGTRSLARCHHEKGSDYLIISLKQNGITLLGTGSFGLWHPIY
jgi:hypothetical protein